LGLSYSLRWGLFDSGDKRDNIGENFPFAIGYDPNDADKIIDDTAALNRKI